MRFIKLEDQIFAIDDIAYVGVSHGILWEVHVILKCTPNSAFRVAEFGTEKQAQEYLSDVMVALLE